ncbi:hypothetical protein GCM10020331_078040 [Ectobacillus funiculus]
MAMIGKVVSLSILMEEKLVFVGDLTDRGPKSLETAALVWELVVHQKQAYYSPGNHCNKLYRFFIGRKVQQTHGLETTVAEYEALGRREQKNNSKSLSICMSPPHYIMC